ncbi:MAG: enoyl-CoA hydratase/isomerase family protein [Candidatus Helarchaeota archaeon]
MSEQSTEKVIYEKIKKVVRITFNNGKNNLFDVDQVIGFRDALLKIKNNPKVRALLIQANGERFSAGFHLKEMTTNKESLEIFKSVGQEFIKILYTLPIPTICLVQSYAIGIACLVPFACDFRFCLKDVAFCLPEINYNFMFPTHGGMTITPKIVRCDSDAKYILMTGEHITWELADKMGLVTKTFETLEELREKGLEFAITLSKKNPATMSMIKACFDKTKIATISEGIEIENEAMMANVAGSKEKQDLINKFIKTHQLL